MFLIIFLIVAIGTELAVAYSLRLVMITTKKLYKRYCPSSLMRYYWIGLSSIDQDSLLLPLVRVWVISQSQCGLSFEKTS